MEEHGTTVNMELNESMDIGLNEISAGEDNGSSVNATAPHSRDDGDDTNLSLSDDYDEDDDDALDRAKGSYFHIPYGFQSLGSYKHASKNCEIGGGK